MLIKRNIASALHALFAILLVISSPSFSQTIDGNLVGTVVDPTGATVPNADVDIENTATGVKYTTRTGPDGLYRFNNVPVGTYDVRVKAAGFADTTVRTMVELNRTGTANVNLQVQGVTAEVAVVEAPSTIDTTNAQVQSTFQAEQIVNVPIIETAGNFYGALNLSLLSAGVASNGGLGQGIGPSVGGQRPMNNNFMVEGVDNNRKDITGPLVYIPTDATQEFSILQNQYTAEFGHSTGGQFNTIIKSGTNDLHGSLYEYFQNRKLNATGEEFKRQGLGKPRYDQNRLGGSVGGPIIKNKWFYFGNFEYAPLGQAFTLSSPVSSPTAAGYALLDAMPNLSKTNLAVLKQYATPAPVAKGTTLVNGVPIPYGILPIAGKNYTNQYAVVGTSDYNFSERDQLRGRFAYNRIDQLDTDANLPAFWTTSPQRIYLFTAALYHTFGPSLTNESRIGFNRFTQQILDPGIQFTGLDRFPNITSEELGLNIGPNPNAPQSTIQNTYQFVDNLSWTSGRHTIRFGFDGRRSISPQHFIQRERGDYVYSQLENYLLDLVPDNLAERNLGTTQYYGNQWATYFYAQDDWHVRRNLTINLGLRYERTTVPVGMTLQKLNAIASVPGLIDFREPKTNNKGFAPRIGLAYSPGVSGTTSIRAGFGMAYDVIFDNVGSTAYPPQLSATVDADTLPAIFKSPFLASGGIRPGSVPTGSNLNQSEAREATSSYIPDQVLPYSVQWNLGVQHQFAQDYTLEVRYLGTRGVHLLVQNRMFIFPLVTPSNSLPTYFSRPSQAALDALPITLTSLQANDEARRNPVLGPFGFTQNVVWWPPIGNSQYHGLATQLTRRFTRGFQAVASYTWSHNIDDSTATHFSTYLTPRRQQDFMNLRADKSDSALDRRHRLSLNWLYEPQWMKGASTWAARNLLGNWRWVTTYTYESPEYVTVQSGVDSNLNGDSAGDRTIINPSGDPNKGSSVTALRNTRGDIVAYVADDPGARYVKAGLGALPNSGRNTLPTRPTNNFDMSFAKKFTIGENKDLEFRGDIGNIFNHPQYTPGYINSVRLQDTYVTSRSFLIPGDPSFAKWDEVFASNSRSVQLVLRFVF
jgi:outer membrane receptor protein involved in Fe transport